MTQRGAEADLNLWRRGGIGRCYIRRDAAIVDDEVEFRVAEMQCARKRFLQTQGRLRGGRNGLQDAILIGAAQDGLAAIQYAPSSASLVEGEVGFQANGDDAWSIGYMEQLRDINEQHARDDLPGDPLVKEVNALRWIKAQRAVHRDFNDEVLKFHNERRWDTQPLAGADADAEPSLPWQL